MKQLALAFKAFFRILGDPDLVDPMAALLEAPQADVTTASPDVESAPKPERSEALTLLAALQREGRLVDFLMEPIDAYQDAQIGAAVRDVHRDCAQVLQRMFDLTPLRSETEGDALEVPAGFDPTAVRLTGQVTGEPPYRGVLRHPGWQAARCDLPTWTGQPEHARVIAACEVELS